MSTAPCSQHSAGCLSWALAELAHKQWQQPVGPLLCRLLKRGDSADRTRLAVELTSLSLCVSKLRIVHDLRYGRRQRLVLSSFCSSCFLYIQHAILQARNLAPCMGKISKAHWCPSTSLLSCFGLTRTFPWLTRLFSSAESLCSIVENKIKMSLNMLQIKERKKTFYTML